MHAPLPAAVDRARIRVEITVTGHPWSWCTYPVTMLRRAHNPRGAVTANDLKVTVSRATDHGSSWCLSFCGAQNR
jgi:hypothetical protein